MFRIREVGPHQWQLSRISDGEVLATRGRYEGCLASLAASGALTAAAMELGVLPDHWVDDGGLAFSERTGDGRDFTACQWEFRDPTTSLVPLMLQTETEVGHFGAELAGFHTDLSVAAGVVHGGGRFYDNEAGAAFLGLLNGSGRFGVSVDPGEVDVEWVCTATDPDGFCTEEEASFTRYQVIGVTGTPFPAFANAAIMLEPAGVAAPAVAVAAGGTLAHQRAVPAGWRPEAAWFTVPEPDADSPLMVEQGGQDGEPVGLACPLTIEGRQVFGHLAYWGQCHIGYSGVCISPPSSQLAYAPFYQGPEHFLRAAGVGALCSNGTRADSGPVTAACDHALATLRAAEARDHYAHAGLQWADVAVVDGVYGPWACGALRPDVTDDQVEVLRQGAWSGDWRELGGNLELIGVLAVTTPGFPEARRRLAASGLQGTTDAGRARAHLVDGEQVSLVAAGVVARCPDCARAALARRPGVSQGDLRDLLATVAVIERRTRHLVPVQAAAELARLPQP